MEDSLIEIIKNFNNLMKQAIKGPNCVDPSICHGDCCSIKIDVPKELAEKYIELGFANKEDFIRSDVFSFHLRFDESTGKCFLFNKQLNGCGIHYTGIKPPQCWIYPTNFSNLGNKEISCKRAKGWQIINPEMAVKAEEQLKKFIERSEKEAKEELEAINERIISKKLIKIIQEHKPSRLAGFVDCWEELKVLSAEGFSLQMKKFCQKHNDTCEYLPDSFMECHQVCKEIAEKLIDFLKTNLKKFIKTEGADTEGEYPFYKLFKDSY